MKEEIFVCCCSVLYVVRRENEIIILLLDKDARNDFSSSYKKMMYSLFHVLSNADENTA